MKRLFIAAALLGLGSAVPALASEAAKAPPDAQQPLALSDEQLDSVKGGDLLGLGLNLSALDTLNVNLQANLTGLPTGGGLLGGILGGGTLTPTGQGPFSPLLNTVNGLLGSLGL